MVDINNGLRLYEAIAICHNLGDPVERGKFSEDIIDRAVRLLVEDGQSMKYVTKDALVNALRYQTERMDKWQKSTK